LLLAREANVVALDKAFATELRADIVSSIQASSHHVLHDDWVHSNKLKRVVSWLCYGIVRAILGVIGYSSER
jgi:cardiolipin synthase A/B